MPAITVDVALKRLLEKWRRGGEQSLLLAFVCPNPDGGAVDGFTRAVHAANRAMEVQRADGEELIDASGAWPGPRGPVAYIHEADSSHLVETWLTEVAATLTKEGWQGLLDVESSEVPEIQLPDKHQIGLSLMLSFPGRPVSGFKTLAPWLSDRRLAESLGDWAADWVTAGADAAYLTRGMATFRLPAQQIREQLAGRPTSSLALASAGLGHARCVKFDVRGRVLVQLRDVDSSWEDRLSELRDVMLTHFRECAYAMIRHAWMPAASAIGLLDVLPPRLPGAGQAPRQYFRYRSDLDGQHVPDACGIQLLTDEHMQEVHDLSRWSTEQISPSRYLVSAPDLAAWFERDQPEERALEQARQALGGAILTKQRLREKGQP